MKRRLARITAFLLSALVLTAMAAFYVYAEPAVNNLPGDYVRMFTTGGKPIWVRVSLTGGGSSITLTPGSSISFRLDYCFDEAVALKPTAGDSLQLFLSDFPKGVFVLPSNMHTSGNMYRDMVITLNFADVGGYRLQDGVDGCMTVTFYVSGDQNPGTFTPIIVGNGTAKNALNIVDIKIVAPGTDPGPSGGPGNGYSLINKHAEHVLYPDGSGSYITQLSHNEKHCKTI